MTTLYLMQFSNFRPTRSVHWKRIQRATIKMQQSTCNN